jgi:hypothetical protein
MATLSRSRSGQLGDVSGDWMLEYCGQRASEGYVQFLYDAASGTFKSFGHDSSYDRKSKKTTFSRNTTSGKRVVE